ncbi:Neprilysin-1 [Nymphon striatum]|nr:Neprilysin-1 [Nymphon striatum]
MYTIILILAAMLISAMDPSTDPCTDFYKFSCGKWSLTHRVPEGRNSINKILILGNKLDTSIEGMLQKPIKPSDNEAIAKAKTFYKLCQAEQNHSVIINQLEEVFRDLGGWPMIDQHWSENNKSWEQLIGKVRRVYGQNIIFRFGEEADPDNPSSNKIKVYVYQKSLNISKDKTYKKSNEFSCSKLHDFQIGWKMTSTSLIELEEYSDGGCCCEVPTHRGIAWKKRVDETAKQGLQNHMQLAQKLIRPAQLRLESKHFCKQLCQTVEKQTLKEIVLQLTGGVISKHDFHTIWKYYRTQYDSLVHVASFFGANLAHAKRKATNLLRFQTQFSRVVNTTHQGKTFASDITKVKVTELRQNYPGINWTNYLNAVNPDGYNESTIVEISDAFYIKDFATTLKATQLSTIYDYVIWKVLEDFPHLLSKQLNDIRRFNADGDLIKKDKERWRQCVEITNSQMGLAVAALFSKNHLFTEGKEEVTEIAENVRTSFQDVIKQSDWIDEESKQKIQKKMDSMKFSIGYPDIIKNDEELDRIYSSIDIKPNNIIYNLFQLRTFIPEEHLSDGSRYVMIFFKTLQKSVMSPDNIRFLQFNKIEMTQLKIIETGEPTCSVNGVLTMLSPITLNAYYHRERNEVIFPAGMMQPPFYNPWSPKSLNYGGIGVIIGHEITHLLDVEVLEETDSEKVFTKKSLLNFLKRSKCVYDHYETITIDLPEQQKQQKRIKARQENIADMSGVKLAFEALKKWEKENHAEMLLPGLSLNHNQLFFLNYAQVWCEVKKKKLNGLKKANTHSPKHMRVIGPLSNSEDFAKVYSCSERSNMNPKNKCTVW